MASAKGSVMAVTRCETTFHDRIAGKYRIGKRLRGRWPSLLFRRRGKGTSVRKIFSTILVRLEFFQPNRESSAAAGRHRSGLRFTPFQGSSHPLVGTAGQQAIRPLSRLFEHLYHRIPGHLSVSHSGFHRKGGWLAPIAGDSLKGVLLRGFAGIQVSGYVQSTSKKWRVLSMPAHTETGQSFAAAVPEREVYRAGTDTMVRHGRQPLKTAGTAQPQDSHRLLPKMAKLTSQRPLRIERLQKRDTIRKLHEIPTVQRSLVRHAGPGSLAETAMPDVQTQLQGSKVSRRTGLAPGIFQQQGERVSASDELVFSRQGQIEREVEELKKVIVQTRRLVAERAPARALPTEAEIVKQIDVERIADQVYRNIERRIRRERETRGF